MATKNNPGKHDCYTKADPDEPLFTLRGKDPIAAWLVGAWVALRAGDLDGAITCMRKADAEWKASGRTNLPYDSDKSIEAQQCGKAMMSWYLGLKLDAVEERLDHAQ